MAPPTTPPMGAPMAPPLMMVKKTKPAPEPAYTEAHNQAPPPTQQPVTVNPTPAQTQEAVVPDACGKTCTDQCTAQGLKTVAQLIYCLKGCKCEGTTVEQLLKSKKRAIDS